jgi:dTDP-4-amino-4,6-dideoxygalactose transaminase
MTAEIPFYDLGVTVRGMRAQLHAGLDEAIDGGYFIGGPLVERFEQRFAQFVGAAHCAGVGNGLDAIRLTLEGYGIGTGDEVIVPAFTYYATWLAVMQAGATPVPVDVDPGSGNLDPALIEAAVGPRTRAIVAVHLFGRAADLAPMRALADRHGIRLIEDAAQSHGAMSSAGMTGSVGDAAAFSFYPTKNLGALGDAGGITTSDAQLDAKIRSRRSYGQGSSKYDHVDTGWNSRLDPLQAIYLSMHLDRLHEWNDRRRQIATRYRAALGDRIGASLGPADVADSVWHHFVLRTERAAFRSHLLEAGIHSDAHYPYSIADLAPMRAALPGERLAGRYPVAERLGATVTSLPIGPWMTDAQVDRVADAIAATPAGLLLT